MHILIFSMLLFLVMGVPIGYAIGLASVIYILLDTDISLMLVAQQICNGADSLVLLALPFFLLAGEIMNAAGITRRLVRLALAMIGPVRGGLSYVVIAVNVLVAMVSGAAIASAAVVGSTLVPAMKKQGYPEGYSAALNASAATIGPIIPPSIGFIIYASVAGGEASIEKLFIAGAVPGLVIALALAAVCAVVSGLRDFPRGERHSHGEFWISLQGAAWGLLMPVIILGGIFGGVVTATEAGVLAVAYGVFVGFFVYRSLTVAKLVEALLVTAKRTASIMLIIACASCFGFLISRQVEGGAFIEFFQGITAQPWLFLAMVIGLILALGTIMEGGSIMIILTPLLLPVLKAYGIDVVHFGVVFQLAIMVGLLTPPVGILLFVMAGVSRVSVKEILRNLWPFYAVLIVLCLVFAFVPGLSMWLVRALTGAS
jgi:tripartite ATP-independent transporter DctM subunit